MAGPGHSVCVRGAGSRAPRVQSHLKTHAGEKLNRYNYSGTSKGSRALSVYARRRVQGTPCIKPPMTSWQLNAVQVQCRFVSTISTHREIERS